MSVISSYENPITGALIVQVVIEKKDVLELFYSEEESEILRSVSNGEATGIEALEALVMLLKKIEQTKG